MIRIVCFLMFIYSGISFMACSQEKANIMQNPSISADNLVEEIAKQIAHYPKEPMYALRQHAFKCYFEIYIDNILVAKNFDDLLAGAFDINRLTFKSGHHKIKYKLKTILI
ncbi:hypothetical protein IUY40_11575 [Flavobacterium sp. ALJ2]|nr:hypothetical protein [Flavobacterium sp. ALJ2]